MICAATSVEAGFRTVVLAAQTEEYSMKGAEMLANIAVRLVGVGTDHGEELG